jgi:actin-related protein
MRCNPSDHPILVTEPTWNTPANRERMAEIMFEEFSVPAFYIANTGVLNAYVLSIYFCHTHLTRSQGLLPGKELHL